jgi:hypothetical protein
MSDAGTYIEGHTMHLPDANGFHASVPTRVVHLLAQTANLDDDGLATFGLRRFRRDALNGARDLLDHRPVCTYDDGHAACDELATDDPANPRPRCHLHPKEA